MSDHLRMALHPAPRSPAHLCTLSDQPLCIFVVYQLCIFRVLAPF